MFSHEKALLFNADETLGIRFESLSYKTFDDVTTNMSKRGKYITLIKRFVKPSHRHETNTPSCVNLENKNLLIG